MQNQWQQSEQLPGHTSPVRCCKWAPSLGRSYQLIATCCNDGSVRIYELRETGKQTAVQRDLFTVKRLETFEKQGEVWSLGWNLTGTVLAASGDDGCRMYKATALGEWKQVGIVEQ